ncbi:MAG: DUF2937 family protein [Pseudomonadota bacterium]
MIARVCTLCVGLVCGGLGAQFPEFSQQYVQRLGGAVDALGEVVADFDTSAAAEGLSRKAALAQMTGGAFVERRRADMVRSFDRYDRLAADLEALQGAGPFTRATMAMRMTDRDVAQAALRAFRPALPLNFAGAAFAGAGFVVGLIAAAAALRVVVWPWRRVRRAR